MVSFQSQLATCLSLHARYSGCKLTEEDRAETWNCAWCWAGRTGCRAPIESGRGRAGAARWRCSGWVLHGCWATGIRTRERCWWTSRRVPSGRVAPMGRWTSSYAGMEPSRHWPPPPPPRPVRSPSTRTPSPQSRPCRVTWLERLERWPRPANRVDPERPEQTNREQSKHQLLAATHQINLVDRCEKRGAENQKR